MTNRFCLRIKETGALSQSMEITDLITKLEDFLPGDALYQQLELGNGTIEMRPIGRLTLRVISNGEERPREDKERESTGESSRETGERDTSQGLPGSSEEDQGADASRVEAWQEPEEREEVVIEPVVDNRRPAKNPGDYRWWPE
jgi:hypothetical protein